VQPLKKRTRGANGSRGGGARARASQELTPSALGGPAGPLHAVIAVICAVLPRRRHAEGSARAQPLVYMAWHMGLTTMTLVLTRLLWSFQGAHTLFLLFVLSVSAWNGACFYFEYFAKRYVSSLQSKKPE
jgi:hypothetical protein